MKRWLWAFCLLVVGLLTTLPSHAFCGFYVHTGSEPLFNEATRVVLMRAGMRTVMSIQNDYKGPPESFALVVPVPVILERANVKTLPASIFDRVDRLTGPRLVEYWEQDPCSFDNNADDKEGGTGTRARSEEGAMGAPGRAKVVVEREFKVDEYDVVILSALDSTALETWLRDNHYQIPNNAEPYLRPYVLAGSKFFVAKVDIARVRFRWGRAALSPLRFHYDTPDFTLPVRLGLINSNGTQDLIVHILAADRYETANYENLTIPTNLLVKNETRAKFNSFYAALFDETVANHPHSVVTEYSWSSQSCDPCPAGASPLADDETQLLGGDVVSGVGSYVVTRLHARYGKDALGDDLVFRTAAPIEGGRDTTRAATGLAHGAIPSSVNNFQGRYIIHHPWTGGAACASPRYGVWGDNNGQAPEQMPRASNPLADRSLHTADYVLASDPPAAHPSGRSLGQTFGVYDWDAGSWFLFLLGAFALAVSACALVAWRRKLGVLKSVGWMALTCAVALAIVLAAERRPSDAAYDLLNHRVVLVLVVIVTAAAIGLYRSPRLGFIPALAGFFEAARWLAQSKQQWREESAGTSISTLSRIVADLTGETFTMIVFGCAIAGVLVIGLSWQPATTKPKWLPVGIAVVGATLARVLLIPHLRNLDFVVMLAMAGAAIVLARTNELRLVVIVLAGVLLLDAATKLLDTSLTLQSVSGESVDASEVDRLLVQLVSAEHRRLWNAVIDVALLVGLVARPKREPLRPRLLAPALLVLIAFTPFEWLGFRGMFGNLGVTVATRDGSSSWLPLDDASLTGPALAVRNGVLEAAPNSETPFALYSDAVANAMARASNDQSPLLLTSSGDTLGNVVAALGPLLKGHQIDYRLAVSRPSSEQIGIYAVLAEARHLDPLAINLVPFDDRAELKAALVLSSSMKMGEVSNAIAAARSGSTPTIVTAQ